MTNADFERRMEFFLEQQAKFEENLAKASARQDRIDRQIEQLVGFSGTLRDAVLGLTHHVERHDQEIDAIRQAIAELVAQGKETDARLNALMCTVERHISGHQ